MVFAFCRTAPSVLFIALATLATGVRALECALRSRISSFDHGLMMRATPPSDTFAATRQVRVVCFGITYLGWSVLMFLRKASLSLAIIWASLVAHPAIAEEGASATVKIVVKAGSEALISGYKHFDKNCAAVEVPTVTILKQPAHGETSMRDESTAVNHVYHGSGGNCVGKLVQSRAVYYTPATGYVGKDKVDIAVKLQFPDKVVIDHFYFLIDVR
jgi:hypothetical protein